MHSESSKKIIVKLVLLGGFASGKTTLVGSVSEIEPLTTEEPLSAAGAHVDDLAGLETKKTTTVGIDYGRRTLDRYVLALFGAPGQPRYGPIISGILDGAAGAIVLVDIRTPERVAEAWDAIDRVEAAGVPFVVAVNEFPGALVVGEDELRTALNVGPDVPVTRCDATDRKSSVAVLITLMQHLIHRHTTAGVPA